LKNVAKNVPEIQLTWYAKGLRNVMISENHTSARLCPFQQILNVLIDVLRQALAATLFLTLYPDVYGQM